MSEPMPTWAKTAEAVAAELESGPEGLTQAQAVRRLHEVGANVVSEMAGATLLHLVWRQVSSPLVLILLVGALISSFIGEHVDAAIILTIVLGSAVLGFVQEARASSAVAKLRQRLALTSHVRRDGALRTVPAAELVPGDVIELSAGNLIPADGRVLSARDFLVSEASLTGEAFPVEKQAGVVPAVAALRDRTNCVFLGSSVRSGTATVLLTDTGRRTVMGDVMARMALTEPETEFARGVRRFGGLLMRVMFGVVVAVLVANQWLGRPIFDSLMFAVALAVGLSPELLPAIVSVGLARSARALAQRGVWVRRLDAIEDLGGMDVLCTDKTGTLTRGVMTLEAAVDARGGPDPAVLRWAYLNAAFESGIENPLDEALMQAGQAQGLTTEGWRKIDEVPYDFVRRRLAIVLEPVSEPDHHLLIVKGAFAQTVAVCTRVRTPDGGAQPLDEAMRQALEAHVQAQGERGLRVLAVATRRLPVRAAHSIDDEAELVFEGFVAFADPPKPGAAQAVRDLAVRGVQVKIITGDNRYVAAHVAEQVGLDARAMVTGEALSTLDDEALWHLAERTALFVEVDPAQKERIVRALQRTGHAVGYLGDGINDAPALHAADVGISVDQAVDVARESADLVLTQPDLDTLRRGVEGGRATFANTLKYISISISANFGNMISMALATPLLPFLPLTAAQILLNNFLSDLPSVTISTDRVDAEHLQQPQRWSMPRLRRFMVVFGLISSAFDLLTFAVLLRVFQAGEAEFRTTWFVTSVLTELGVVLVLRTQGPAWRSRPSRLLGWATLVVALVVVALPHLRWVAEPLALVPLPGPLMAAVGAIVLAYLAVTEAAKALLVRHDRHR